MTIEKKQIKRIMKSAKKSLPVLVPLLPLKGYKKVLVVLGVALARQLNKHKQVCFTSKGEIL